MSVFARQELSGLLVPSSVKNTLSRTCTSARRRAVVVRPVVTAFDVAAVDVRSVDVLLDMNSSRRRVLLETSDLSLQ
jgi:hypothetical protein